jgi:hypothetical protein
MNENVRHFHDGILFIRAFYWRVDKTWRLGLFPRVFQLRPVAVKSVNGIGNAKHETCHLVNGTNLI